MAQLVIDEGNTLIKAAVFNGPELVKATHYSLLDAATIQGLVNEYGINKIVLSSVRRQEDNNWQQHISGQVPVVWFDRNRVKGIHNHYRTPHTLGLDRLAGIMGAQRLYPEQNCLVIDAGTCITYDSIDAAGNYFGGSISPGLNMRYQALSHYTAALPLVEADNAFTASYGDDTTQAIRSGVQNGIRYEVLGFIDNYIQGIQSPCIILTGGDGVFLHTLLKNSIFAGYIKSEPYLVLQGLNAAITEHND